MIVPFLVSMKKSFFRGLSLQIGYKPPVSHSPHASARPKGSKTLKVRSKSFRPAINRIKQCSRGRGNTERGAHQSRVF